MTHFESKVNEMLLKQLEEFKTNVKTYGNINNEGYVYIVTDNVTNVNGQVRCKIGKSIDPYSRIHQLNKEYETTIKLSHLIIEPIVFFNGYSVLERKLHTEFTEQHISGEWYWLSVNDIKKCIEISHNHTEPNKKIEVKPIEYELIHYYIYTEYGYKIDLGDDSDDAFQYFIDGGWYYDEEVDKFPKEPKYLFLTYGDIPIISINYNTDEYVLYEWFIKNNFMVYSVLSSFQRWHYVSIMKLTHYDSNYKPTFPLQIKNYYTIEHYLDAPMKGYNPKQLLFNFDTESVITEKEYYN